MLKQKLLCLFCIINFWQICQADIVFDGSLGRAEVLNGQDLKIDAALGQQMGNNLFHSFKIFNLQSDQIAHFTGNSDIKNVISRVTGGELSQIDGTIQSSLSADFYFINPAGIVFGKNAKLDLAGSAHFSTANVIKLGEYGQFSAATSQKDILTVAPPNAFGFLDATPAALTVQGSQLQLATDQKFSLFSGKLVLNDSNIMISEGKIQLVSVAAPAELNVQNNELTTINSTVMGDISLTNTTLEVNGGGAFVVRGGQIGLHSSILLARTIDNDSQGIDVRAENLDMIDGRSLLSASTDGRGRGGMISIQVTENIRLAQNSRLAANSRNKEDQKNGDAGTIHLTADTVEFSDNAQIQSASFGTGGGGVVRIDANDIHLNNARIFVTAGSERPDAGTAGNIVFTTNHLVMQQEAELNAATIGGGDAGTIQIAANAVHLSDKAKILSITRSTGQAGKVHIDAKQDITLENALVQVASESTQLDAGDAGDITLETDSLILRQNSQLSSLSINGNAGTINIQAKKVHLAEKSGISSIASGIGRGGKITINATQEAIFDRSAAFTNTESEQIKAGDAGDITLTTDKLLMQNGSQLSSMTFNSGQGGKIVVHANHAIFEGYALGDDLAYAAGLDTSTEGSGNAGHIQLTANTLEIKGGAAINSSTRNGGHAGQITIDVAQSIAISGDIDAPLTERQSDNLGRGITSTSIGINAGQAGNLLIRTPILNLTDRGQISTSAQQAQAGKITLEVDRLNLQHAEITSEAKGDGDAGNIVINATDQLTLVQSNISTQAQHAAGGNISLAINGQVLHLAQGAITTSVKGGMGGGGDIRMTHPKFTILNDSQVIAQADGGNGGNILISPQHFVASPISLVSASSRRGIDGAVIINAPESDVSCGLTGLPNNFLAADALLKKACRHLTEDELSSRFVVQPSIGVPNLPEDLQSSVTYFR